MLSTPPAPRETRRQKTSGKICCNNVSNHFTACFRNLTPFRVLPPDNCPIDRLKDMYEALQAPLLSVEERLDVLLHLKWTVSEFDCRLTRDIAELVDREADLLSRGRGEASLRPLRQRIRNLFLRFAETPDFNPEASRFIRVPPKYGKLTDEGMAGLTGVVSCK